MEQRCACAVADIFKEELTGGEGAIFGRIMQETLFVLPFSARSALTTEPQTE